MSCPSFHLSPSRPRWFWWMESNADPFSRVAFFCACAKKICSACSAPFWYFQQRGILLRMRQENLFGAFGVILIFSARFCGFQLSDRHLSVIGFGEGWKSMTSLPPFLTLWILVKSSGSSDEDILKASFYLVHFSRILLPYEMNFVYYKTRRLKLSNFPWFLKHEMSDTTNG